MREGILTNKKPRDQSLGIPPRLRFQIPTCRVFCTCKHLNTRFFWLFQSKIDKSRHSKLVPRSGLQKPVLALEP